MKIIFDPGEEKEITKQLSSELEVIMRNLENKFSSEFSMIVSHAMDKINEKINEKNDKVYQLLMTNIHSLTNIRILFEDISVLTKVNAEKYVIKYFKNQEYKEVFTWYDENIAWGKLPSVINKLRNEKRNGRPDLIVYDSDELYFLVEVKTNNDGLRGEQVRWILNHPDITVVVFYLIQHITGKAKPP